MKKQEFLEKLQIALNSNKILTNETILDNLSEWDSLSKVAVITMFEEDLKINIDYTDLEKIKTIQDLITLAELRDKSKRI